MNSLHPIHYPVANPSIGDREKEYLQDCIKSNWISSSGKYIVQFEKLFSKKLGPGHCVAVSNCTVAIELALRALGITLGDEVIVPNLTFAGSAAPIQRIGAIPVLAPTAKNNWNIDVNSLKNLLSPKTKAIVAVHLYGVPCDIKPLVAFAKENNLRVIEDCAEALGAKIEGNYTGTFGDIACYSFFGNKILTTGEGGMCMAKTLELAEMIKLYKDHGMMPKERYWHRVIGYNGRMTNMQAAVGVGQLESIENVIKRRNEIHEIYQEYFSKNERFLNLELDDTYTCVTWLESPVLQRESQLDRNQLQEDLRRDGIDTRPFFYPLSSTPAFNRFGDNDPNSDYFGSHGFNLPTYTTLTNEDIRFIGAAVCKNAEKQNLQVNGMTLPPVYPSNNQASEKIDISVILPTYNEENNCARLITILRKQMISISQNYEILVMDDQSTDRTVSEIEEKFVSDSRIKVFVRSGEKGLALSIYDGIAKAKGNYLLIMDSDFNHDPSVTSKMVQFALHYDIVSGSRFTTGGGMDSSFRWWGSLIFNTWLRILLILPTQDNLAGFFCIKREKLESLDLDAIFRNYGDYFFRCLYHAKKKRYSILEIPIYYNERTYGISKTNFVKTLLLYVKESLKFRFQTLLNRQQTTDNRLSLVF